MVASVAAELGIDEARGGLTPDDKLAMLERLHGEGRRVLMLGDGVNDVPVLAGADISVAMGSATDLAKTSADAVLLSTAWTAWCRLSGCAPHPPYHHREPGLGQPVQWPGPALRRARLDHPGLGGDRHVGQFAAGGGQRPAADPNPFAEVRMAALYILIPVAIVIVAIAIYVFFWAVDSGQYDDLDGPAHSILFDDEDPKHQAGVDEAEKPSKPEDRPRG